MAAHADIPRVSMQLSQGVLVASIQVDLEEDVLARFREDLLDRVHESGSRAVILDVSGLETLDSEEFASLRRIITMTRLLGADSVLAGLQPGIVAEHRDVDLRDVGVPVVSRAEQGSGKPIVRAIGVTLRIVGHGPTTPTPASVGFASGNAVG